MLRKAFILIIILILGALAVFAEGSIDPNLDEDANACYDGGTMAGKCEVDFNDDGVVDEFERAWAWECGWYMIRLEAGIFSEIPERCETLIPSEPVETVTVTEEPSAGNFCYYEHSSTEFSIYEIIAPGEYKFASFGSKTFGYSPCPPDLPL